MQGYSQMNRGYNEQPGINWGKVALYGAGAAAGYGLIRAGAMKLRPHLNTGMQSGKAIGGGILGLNMEGGWKGFQKLGALSWDPSLGERATGLAQAAKTNQIMALKKESQEAVRAGRAKDARQSAKIASTYQQAESIARQQKMVNSQIEMGASKSNLTKLNAEKAALAERMTNTGALFSAQNKAQELIRAKAATEKAGFAGRLKTLKAAPLDTQAYMGQAIEEGGALARYGSAATGFFGAMDYATEGGMKRFGVGAARVGLAAAGIGLGMKALGALNPFSD